MARWLWETHCPRVVNTIRRLPHGPRLAWLKTSTSLRGCDPCARRFHLSCEIPSLIGTTVAARQTVASRAIRVLTVKLPYQFGSGLLFRHARIPTIAPKSKMLTKHQRISGYHCRTRGVPELSPRRVTGVGLPPPPLVSLASSVAAGLNDGKASLVDTGGVSEDR